MSLTLTIILIVLLVILILLSALFSASETAYSSVSYARIESEANKGKKAAKLIQKHYKSFGWTLATILISNNLVNVISSVLISYLFAQALPNSDALALIISTCVMTPVIVVFGEITPKLLAKKYSWGYLTKVVYAIEALNWIFFPLTFPLRKIALSTRVTNTEKELKTIISLAAKEGVLEKREATLAKNALDLDSTKVGQVMTKREDTITIEKGSTIKAAKKLFQKTGHSRVPVTSNGRYVGMIIIKDIVFVDKGTIDDFILKPPYVSKHKITTRALEQLRKASSHLAFVVPNNDSKKVLGIVTLEDIVEELIGEIYDEHDKVEPIREVGLHKYVANGSATMENLSKLLKFKFENSEDLTVKQWVQSRINRNIKTGLSYTYKSKYFFKITSNKNGEETIIEITIK